MLNRTGALVLALLLSMPISTSARAAEPAATGETPAVETLYLRAQPSTALLATPAATAAAIRQLTPGDAVTVLGREAGFVNVQAADGVQGWLRETDLTSVAPAAMRVAELEREAARLREDLAGARDSLEATEARLRQARQATASARENGADESAALEAETADLRAKLAVATDEIARLEAQLTQIATDRQAAREAAELLAARQPAEDSLDASRFSNIELAVGAAAALGLALLGVWFGTATARRKMRRRYHGLEL